MKQDYGEYKAQTYDPDTYVQATGANGSPLQRKGPTAAEKAPNVDEFVTVDPKVYTSTEILAEEFDKVWPATWVIAGRASDVVEIGSWFKFDIGNDSFLIVRGEDNELRALYNVCQHRGNRLVSGHFGRRRSFVCPYHSWRYNLSGRNIRVTDRETFRPQALSGDLGLPSVRCETHAGMVFINIDGKAPDLLTFLGPAAEVMSFYRLEDMHVVKDIEVDVNSNWKAGMHAFMESYHVHITHPGAYSAADELYSQLDFYDFGHSRAIYEMGDASPRIKENRRISDVQRLFLQDAGVDPETFQGGNFDVRKALQTVKRKPDNKFGFDYSRFSDEQLSDNWVITLFPNSQMTIHPEGVMFSRWHPDSEDPGKHELNIMTLGAKLAEGSSLPFYMGVEPGTDMSGRVRPERCKVEPTPERIGQVLAEDVANLQESHYGMKSRGLKKVRFSQQEQRIQYHFAEWQRRMSA